ncbi:uncharacterized protein K441DRAFT_664182 [Cenococcum geophilum 1.58]|uniref:uncharacterized protein n=1 Tax=Cenococcum geophilum 1.58 TaxID=794803 RepID=UPI00358F3C18|nr:hypothetical protein K441DRAFT_664182 [Cenococcum geophilum 1.58]
MSLTVETSSDWPVFPLQPPLYVCIRLRAPRLLRPSYESPFDATGPSKLACVSAA